MVVRCTWSCSEQLFLSSSCYCLLHLELVGVGQGVRNIDTDGLMGMSSDIGYNGMSVKF